MEDIDIITLEKEEEFKIEFNGNEYHDNITSFNKELKEIKYFIIDNIILYNNNVDDELTNFRNWKYIPNNNDVR